MNFTFLKLALMGAVLGIEAQAGERVVFVVNDKSPAKELNLDQIKEIYLKEKVTWDGDGSIVALDQREGTAAHRLLLKKIVKKSVSEWEAYWIELKHSRGEQKFQQISSDSMMLQMVEAIDGSIGYVSASAAGVDTLKSRHLKVLAAFEE